MQVLGHLHPRFILISRVIMWSGLAVLMMVGVFANAPAWAETAACAGNGSTGHSSIPITKTVLYLIYDGPAQTYQISLCENADAPVNIVATARTPNLVTIAPSNFSLMTTAPQSVAVAVNSSRPRDVPFSVEISHTASSADPDFNYGALNMPKVTAHYSPPVASGDIRAVHVNESIAINVLLNDTDQLGQGLHLEADAIELPPEQGTATVNTADDVIQYTAPNQPGLHTLVYRVDDAIGNTDNATVTFLVVPANVRFPMLFSIDPGGGISPILILDDGSEIVVTVPPLTGVAPDAVVECVIGEVAQTSANLSTNPFSPNQFTGLAFYLQCYVDGEPVTAAQLTTPITINVTLVDSFLAHYHLELLKVANWNGVEWRTAGVTSTYALPRTLIVKTTLFGEFLVFSEFFMALPRISYND